MRSPFPGIDPYVEPNWLDVHATLIAEARRSLNRSLPAGLVARVEERVAVESEEDRLQRVGPDVRVFSPSTADPDEGKHGIVIEAPFKLVVDIDPIIERFIRIVDEDGELITVIEFVSPTNKRPPGLDAFRQERAELLAAGVHFVEADLVRAGNWRALMRPETLPPEAVSLYRALVRTSGRRPSGYLFPITCVNPYPRSPCRSGRRIRPTACRSKRCSTPPTTMAGTTKRSITGNCYPRRWTRKMRRGPMNSSGRRDGVDGRSVAEFVGGRPCADNHGRE